MLNKEGLITIGPPFSESEPIDYETLEGIKETAQEMAEAVSGFTTVGLEARFRGFEPNEGRAQFSLESHREEVCRPSSSERANGHGSHVVQEVTLARGVTACLVQDSSGYHPEINGMPVDFGISLSSATAK